MEVTSSEWSTVLRPIDQRETLHPCAVIITSAMKLCGVSFVQLVAMKRHFLFGTDNPGSHYSGMLFPIVFHDK